MAYALSVQNNPTLFGWHFDIPPNRLKIIINIDHSVQIFQIRKPICDLITVLLFLHTTPLNSLRLKLFPE
jgi:hypothetical protein